MSLTPGTPLKITCPGATATQGTIFPSAGHDEPVFWHATANTSSDEVPVFKLGTDEKIVDLPIKVKIMKNRIVKVAVYRVHQPGARPFFTWDDETLPAAQRRDASRENEIRHQLEKIFPTQLNAWFQLDFFETELNYDTAGFPESSAPNAPDGTLVVKSVEEAALANNAAFSGTKTSHDINVLLLNDISFKAKHPETGIYIDVNGSSIRDSNTCIIPVGLRLFSITTHQPDTFNASPKDVGHTMAHEIGHLMVGYGHPDEYKANKADSGGFAPLQTLRKTTDFTQRLMCSGTRSLTTSNLLVKKEWDLAEEWLVKFVDDPTQ